jgi:hypothetical protein
MSISLKDAIQPNFGFQGALQGAGTPNQAGIGGFLPLAIGDNSVFFLDAQANANFADFNEYSSIINTKVAGTTISTSSRLGYRWLNGNRSWMFGVNAGYDSRPMNTGGTDNGVNVTNSRSVFFQQVALNLEAASNKWSASAYLLYPVGEYGYNKMPARINDFYYADSVMTTGVDIGYNLTPNLKASVGYYYLEGDLGTANGNSVRGRLEYNIANGLTTGINIAYDPAFSEGYSSGEFYKTLNLSADLKWRFGANGYGAPSIRKQQPVVMPVIQALSATPANRDIRVHDLTFLVWGCWGDNLNPGTTSDWGGKFWSHMCDNALDVNTNKISKEWGAIYFPGRDGSGLPLGSMIKGTAPYNPREGTWKNVGDWFSYTRFSKFRDGNAALIDWTPDAAGVCEKPGVSC